MKAIPLLVLGCLLGSLVQAATLRGLVTDEQGKPLAFVSVYVEGTSKGTTTNTEGRYLINLNDGDARLAFRFIGYKFLVKSVQVTGDVEVNVTLIPESYNLGEVNISASAEDPAYAILRKAMEKRKFYLTQDNEFSCDAYTKFLQKILSHPKKFLGQDVDLSEQLDSTTGIIYLSESVSKLSFRQPDEVKEEMISSKVSGRNNSFSFNQAAGLLFNFYENLIDLGEIGQRGFVSPVASNAMLFYKYQYEGQFVENGVTVNKIKVIPKRRRDPVFSGTIFIQDDSWRIHSLDLIITKESPLQFVDTVAFHQVYVPVNPDVWMPFSAQVDFVFKVFGFYGNGYFLGISSNYNIAPAFPKKYFDGEVLKVNRDANKRDSIYWLQARQVPLTLEENKDYSKRDSASALHESKPYRDSIDRKNNKFKPWGFILGGYSYDQSYYKRRFSVSPLISNIQYNTVEGWNAGFSLLYRKGDEEEEGRNSRIEGNIRYGFSNGHLNGYAGYRKRYNPSKLGRYGFFAGTQVIQFNAEKPISELINTAYSLAGEKNYMKIYERRFVEAFHTSELMNGLQLRVESGWEKRLPLVNTSSVTINDKESRTFSSNDPLHPGTDTLHFSEHEAFLLDARLNIIPGQEYISRPDGKFVTGTNWPEFSIHYTQAFDGLLGSDVAFSKFSVGAEKEFNLGLFGRTNLDITYGNFIESRNKGFMDFKHFNGNQTIFSDFLPGSFKLLSYYDYSTLGAWFTGYAEHHFGGFILNKIPLIRKLKLDEVVGVHYLQTEDITYTELSFGLEKLGIFRIDFVTSFTRSGHSKVGFVLGIKGL